MGGNFSRLTSRPTGNTINGPADDAEFDNIITNMTPSGLDDNSANIAQMRSTADPYPGLAESLATSTAGELERLRYSIQQITGQSQWYVDPPTTLVQDYTQTFKTLNLITKGPWVDVKAHGAIGDGSTDDTAAIQAAIDSYGQETGATATGGVVYFPPGTYKVTSQLDMYSGVHIVGSGMQSTKVDGNTLTSGNYVFKNVNNARYFSYRDITVAGSLTTTAKGGIFIGNDSGDAGYTSYVSMQNVEIIGFSTTGAIGLNISNPSHVFMSNVVVYGIPNGECLLIIGNMAQTGVFHFSGCKFGAFDGDDIAMRIASSTSSAGAVENVAFTGCYFGGEGGAGMRAVVIEAPSGGATISRGITFDTCHMETQEGTEVMLVEAIHGLRVTDCSFYGYAGSYVGATNGIHFTGVTATEMVTLKNNQYIDIIASGAAVKVDTGGTYSALYPIKTDLPRVLTTAPTFIDDPDGAVQLESIKYARRSADQVTTGVGEDTLDASTIPAKALIVNGKIKVHASGTITGGAGVKTIKLYLGATFWSLLPGVNSTSDWRLEAEILSVGTTSHRISWSFWDGNTSYQGYETATDDSTASLAVKLTGECANGADIITQTTWEVDIS